VKSTYYDHVVIASIMLDYRASIGNVRFEAKEASKIAASGGCR